MRRLIRQRNRDFIRECHRQTRLAFRQGEVMTVRKIVTRAVASTAPRYYLSFDSAYARIGSMLKHGLPEPPVGTSRRSQLIELSHRVSVEMERTPGLILKEAVARVIARGDASSYFLSMQSAVRLYYQLRTGRRAARRRSRRLF